MDPTIVALARAYARRIESGSTPAAALAYIRQHFDPASPEEINLAVAQAQTAMSIGFNLAQLEPGDHLRDALLGRDPPAPTVAVRVEIFRTGMGDVKPDGTPTPRYNTVYIPMSWDATVADVLHAVEEYAVDNWSQSGPPSAIGFRFAGPTLWPMTP